jgi:hypothetical protein
MAIILQESQGLLSLKGLKLRIANLAKGTINQRIQVGTVSMTTINRDKSLMLLRRILLQILTGHMEILFLEDLPIFTCRNLRTVDLIMRKEGARELFQGKRRVKAAPKIMAICLILR